MEKISSRRDMQVKKGACIGEGTKVVWNVNPRLPGSRMGTKSQGASDSGTVVGKFGHVPVSKGQLGGFPAKERLMEQSRRKIKRPGKRDFITSPKRYRSSSGVAIKKGDHLA